MREADKQLRHLSSGLQVALFVCFLMAASVSPFGQSARQHKDLVFPQVAAGDTLETMITLSNTGDFAYNGTISFTREGSNPVWNPIVNGSPITNGQIHISLFDGETRTYLVTGSVLTVGFVRVTADDDVLDNFVEGNLTYRFKSGTNIVDAVGVLPASEIYFANLPFDDFATVALALANIDYWGRAATVSLRLFDGPGAQVKTQTIVLAKNAHRAQFLSELLQVAGNSAKGRVEISSNVPLCVTALALQRSGQLSALPIAGSPVSYDLRAVESGGMVSLGEITLWVDGYFVKGYMRVREFDSLPTDEFYYLSGALVDGTLRLAFHGNGASLLNADAVVSSVYENFTIDKPNPTGSYTVTFLDDYYVVKGTFSLTRR